MFDGPHQAGEPNLEALLDEPIVRLLMRRDQVTRGEVQRLLTTVRDARRHQGPLEHAARVPISGLK